MKLKSNITLPDSTRNYDISQFLQALPQFTSTSTERSLPTKPFISQELEKIINLLKFKRLPFEIGDKEMLQTYFEKQFSYFQKFKGSLGSEQYEQLIENLDIEEFKMKQVIFRQGEGGRKMYFVLFGEVSILVKTEFKNPLQGEGKVRYRGQKFEHYLETHFPSTKVIGLKKEGDYFGEIAIEQRVPRTATSVARTYCVLAVLTFNSYNQLLRSHQNDALRYKYEMVKQFEPFNLWQEQELFLLLHGCEEFQTLKGNSVIYKRYQSQNHIYLILEGEVLVQGFKKVQLDEYKDEMISHRIINISCFGRGQIFGDYEIYKGVYQASTQMLIRITQAIAKETTTVIIIPISKYLQSIKENMGQQWYQDYLTNKYGTKVKWWKPKEDIQLEISNTKPTKKKNNLKIDLNESNNLNFISKGYLSPQVEKKQYSPRTLVKFKKLKSTSPIKKEKLLQNSQINQDMQRQKSDSYYQSRINSLLRRQSQLKVINNQIEQFVYQFLESPFKLITDSSHSQFNIQIKSPKSPKSPQLSYFSSAKKRSQSIHKFFAKTKAQF